MKCIFCHEEAGKPPRRYGDITEIDIKETVLHVRGHDVFVHQPESPLELCVYCTFVRCFRGGIAVGTVAFTERSREHRLADAMRGLAR